MSTITQVFKVEKSRSKVVPKVVETHGHGDPDGDFDDDELKDKVKEAMKGQEPWKEDDLVERFLKRFDMDMKYGPSSGISRLDRWNRADGLGLSPPCLVRDLLLSRGLSVSNVSLWDTIRTTTSS